MKIKILFVVTAILCPIMGIAQSYNLDRVSLTNYLIRMYDSSPFEGVRIVQDYDNTYLLSVVNLMTSLYESESNRSRVASVKAMSQAGKYFDGSTIQSETIIYTSDNINKTKDVKIIEKISENSIAHIQQLELLTSIIRNDRSIYFFIKQIETPQKKRKRRN